MYIIKFDKNGRRIETYLTIRKTQEQIAEMLNNGYEIIEKEIYQLLLGNIDGQEHIRVFDEQGKPQYPVYVPPAPTLEEVKEQKIAELKNERDTLEVEPVEYNGNTFDFDEKARERINNAIIALDGTEHTLEWTMADNTNVTVNATDLRNVIITASIRSNTLHVAYREAKVKVEEATTKEEVEAIALEV